MANTFQRVIYDVTTSYATAYTCPGSTTAIVIGFNGANVHASNGSWFSTKTVTTGGGSEAIMANQIEVSINDSFNPIQGKLVLEAGDYIQLQAENASSIEATISILEIS
jgi:hypothetical protein